MNRILVEPLAARQVFVFDLIAGQDSAAGRKSQCEARAAPGKPPESLARSHVPYVDGSAVGRSQPHAIRRIDQSIRDLLLTVPVAEFLARGDVPEADGLVIACRGQPLAAG